MDHRTFDDLVEEAASVSVDGWDFSWLDGRATEARPSWGYARRLAGRMATAEAALDIETGGGEILAGVPKLPPVTVATESWPPNLALAAKRLRARGAAVVADDELPRLPFRTAVFDLVVSRHPVRTWWAEIARVLRPGGTYFSQQVGPRSVVELTEFFLGPQDGSGRDPEKARAAAEQAGLTVVDLRAESLRMEFRDIGAVIYFLRKVIWTVPGFSVDRYRKELRELHERIQEDGPFIAHSTRFLIEARA
ncbi:class I SAM-dependent methyltransferase [Nonomuraea aurantiaca]|uniref:class I SAM-dependent methyltransferase n=1 Tax=Nonomuraea aurantiaca TaxID=2878562 RepID=UPI001CDA4D39|nr:class I SAM-dependent methyltransferase [Nonomuraea aurantiaca]MCA2225429.1 class I SAM-dependent methyltransferase [Nonomuraea aurantiaca]